MFEFCIPFNNEEEYPFYIDAVGFSRCDSSYKILRPNAKNYSFEFIMKGNGWVQLEENKIVLAEPGDLFILPPHKTHYYYADNQNPCEKMWVTCNGKFVDGILAAYGFSGIQHIKNVELLPDFMKMYNTCSSGEDKTEIFNLCSHTILSIIQKAPQTPTDAEPGSIAERIKYEIDESQNINISLNDIISHVFCSKAYAINVFKARYGITPYQYIIQKKTSIAKKLLLNTNIPIKSIASNLGFSDGHHFSAFFREHVGLSPRDYRKQASKTLSE